MHAEYRYVDVWVLGRMKHWQRVEVERCQDGFERYRGHELFQSAQLFASPVKSHGEPHFAHLWVDLDDKEGTGGALELARRVSRWFTDQGIGGDLQRWVSTGGHGIHGWVSGHALGAKPSAHLTAVYRSIVEVMASQAEIPTLGPCHLDLAVYTVPRMMRVPGSVHSSGRSAFELSTEELFSVDGSRLVEMGENAR